MAGQCSADLYGIDESVLKHLDTAVLNEAPDYSDTAEVLTPKATNNPQNQPAPRCTNPPNPAQGVFGKGGCGLLRQPTNVGGGRGFTHEGSHFTMAQTTPRLDYVVNPQWVSETTAGGKALKSVPPAGKPDYTIHPDWVSEVPPPPRKEMPPSSDRASRLKQCTATNRQYTHSDSTFHVAGRDPALEFTVHPQWQSEAPARSQFVSAHLGMVASERLG